MDISYDANGMPVLAVGRGAATLEEPCQWVRRFRIPIICQGIAGEFALIHCNSSGQVDIEPLHDESDQAKAAALARPFLNLDDPEHSEPVPRFLRRRSFQQEADWRQPSGRKSSRPSDGRSSCFDRDRNAALPEGEASFVANGQPWPVDRLI